MTEFKPVPKVHKVAGVSYRTDALEALGCENSDYLLSKKEMIEDFLTDGRIWKYEFFPSEVRLVPEPDNPHDPNAIKVLIDGEHVGYIKAGSCKHLLKMLQEDRIQRIEAEIGGGPYKLLLEDEDGDSYELEKDSTPYFVRLTVYELVEGDEDASEADAPVPPVLQSAPASTAPQAAPTRPVPSGPPCWNCGKPTNPGAVICLNCGASLKQAQAAKKKMPSWALIPIFVVGALVLFMVFGLIVSSIPSPAAAPATTEAATVPTEEDLSAWHPHGAAVAESIISGVLKSPSTAKFCPYREYMFFHGAGDIYTVKGWVDAQNEMGATVREKFTVQYSLKDPESWDYLPTYISIAGEISGEWTPLE